jgi:hypothetical protein
MTESSPNKPTPNEYVERVALINTPKILGFCCVAILEGIRTKVVSTNRDSLAALNPESSGYFISFHSGDLYDAYAYSLTADILIRATSVAVESLTTRSIPEWGKSAVAGLIGTASVLIAETTGAGPNTADLSDIPAGLWGVGLYLAMNLVGRSLGERTWNNFISKTNKLRLSRFGNIPIS